jgi:hypothetical protein
VQLPRWDQCVSDRCLPRRVERKTFAQPNPKSSPAQKPPGKLSPYQQKFFGSFFQKKNFFLKKEAKTFVN